MLVPAKVEPMARLAAEERRDAGRLTDLGLPRVVVRGVASEVTGPATHRLGRVPRGAMLAAPCAQRAARPASV